MLFAICSNLVVLPWSVCWQLLPPCIDKIGDGFAAALITGWFFFNFEKVWLDDVCMCVSYHFLVYGEQQGCYKSILSMQH